MYAWLLLAPAYLVWQGVRRVRQGKREFWPAVWWGAAVWPLTAIASIMHLYPPLSRPYYLAWAVAIAAFTPWFIFGIWRVVPLYLREKRKRPSRNGK